MIVWTLLWYVIVIHDLISHEFIVLLRLVAELLFILWSWFYHVFMYVPLFKNVNCNTCARWHSIYNFPNGMNKVFCILYHYHYHQYHSYQCITIVSLSVYLNSWPGSLSLPRTLTSTRHHVVNPNPNEDIAISLY